MNNGIMFIIPLAFVALYFLYDYKKYGTVQKGGKVSQIAVAVFFILIAIANIYDVNENILSGLIILITFIIIGDLIFSRKRDQNN